MPATTRQFYDAQQNVMTIAACSMILPAFAVQLVHLA